MTEEPHGIEAYRFEREWRTPSSEAYDIVTDERQIGHLDLHFGRKQVFGTLFVIENMTETEIHELIDLVDEELLLPADVARDDFLVTVFQGREVGSYSDESPGVSVGDGEGEV